MTEEDRRKLHEISERGSDAKAREMLKAEGLEHLWEERENERKAHLSKAGLGNGKDH